MNMYREICHFSLISSFLIGSSFSESLNVDPKKVELLTQESLEYSEFNKKEPSFLATDIGKKQETNGKTVETTVSKSLDTKDQAQELSNRDLLVKIEISNAREIFNPKFKGFLELFGLDRDALNLFIVMFCSALGNNLSSIDPNENIRIFCACVGQQKLFYIVAKLTDSNVATMQEMLEKTKSSDKIENGYWISCLNQTNANPSLSVKEIQDLIKADLAPKPNETSTPDKNLVANSKSKENSIPNKDSIETPKENSKDNSILDKDTLRITVDAKVSLDTCLKAVFDISANNSIAVTITYDLGPNNRFSAYQDKSNGNKSFSININDKENVVAHCIIRNTNSFMELLEKAINKATEIDKKIRDAAMEAINIIKGNFPGELFVAAIEDKEELITFSSTFTNLNTVESYAKTTESVVNILNNVLSGQNFNVNVTDMKEYNGNKICQLEIAQKNESETQQNTTKLVEKNPDKSKSNTVYTVLKNNTLSSSSSSKFLEQQLTTTTKENETTTKEPLKTVNFSCENTLEFQMESIWFYKMSQLILNFPFINVTSLSYDILNKTQALGKGKVTATIREHSIDINASADYSIIKSFIDFINFIYKISNEKPTKQNEIHKGAVPAKGDESKKPAFLPAKENSTQRESKFVPSITPEAKEINSSVPINVTYNWDIGICWEERQILIPVKILTECKVMG
ncbi:MAG: hypothetical protein LBH08_00295 [Puniceicoccales bacterium]|nr:hypothetical protein [Puniceicoccales bacterium]